MLNERIKIDNPTIIWGMYFDLLIYASIQYINIRLKSRQKLKIRLNGSIEIEDKYQENKASNKSDKIPEKYQLLILDKMQINISPIIGAKRRLKFIFLIVRFNLIIAKLITDTMNRRGIEERILFNI